MISFNFEGENRRIYINANEEDYVNGVLTFKAIDIYSAWKNWCVYGDGLKYPRAFRAIGNDQIGSGVHVGSYFFMQDGWKGIPPKKDNVVMVLVGNLYPETVGTQVLDPLPEYTTTLIMQNSSLTQVVNVSSASSLKDDERAKLMNLPSKEETANAVWDKEI